MKLTNDPNRSTCGNNNNNIKPPHYDLFWKILFIKFQNSTFLYLAYQLMKYEHYIMKSSFFKIQFGMSFIIVSKSV